MNTLFSRFPTIDIKIGSSTLKYHDIWRHVDVNELILPSYINYNWYEIGDGERPDQVSHNLYDTADYYWSFFVVNDRLKAGSIEWPLSGHALEKQIDEKYRDYGVCTMDDYGLVGLDMTYPHIRVSRVASSGASKLASIEKFDHERNQLWLKDVNDNFFFSTIANEISQYNVIELSVINPYEPESDEYAQTEIDNLAWEADAGSMNFEVRQFYPEAKRAPNYYVDEVGEVIGHYEVILSEDGNAVLNYEVENEINEEKRKIRVIRPDLIYKFAEEYERKIKENDRLLV